MATPVLGRRERRKQQTRERIVAAAAASFAEEGFDGTTFDHIAERADVARATNSSSCARTSTTAGRGFGPSWKMKPPRSKMAQRAWPGC